MGTELCNTMAVKSSYLFGSEPLEALWEQVEMCQHWLTFASTFNNRMTYQT